MLQAPLACNIVLELSDESATRRLASFLAAQARAGDCLLLSGDLGAGKTSFARAYIQHLLPSVTEVASPTFTLVHTYDLPSGNMLWHCDLYRLQHASELQELGLDDAFTHGISLIEWPQIAAGQLPDSALSLEFSIAAQAGAEAGRRVHIQASAASWGARLSLLHTVLQESS
jgi:tRNA threonylcarbamoyladenosine biosynthesis protein TsaE